MATIKTAISIDKRLFDQMEKLARKRRIPRSRLFAQAASEFLNKQRGLDITEQLNQAYADGETNEDKAFRRAAMHNMRRLWEGSW